MAFIYGKCDCDYVDVCFPDGSGQSVLPQGKSIQETSLKRVDEIIRTAKI